MITFKNNYDVKENIEQLMIIRALKIIDEDKFFKIVSEEYLRTSLEVVQNFVEANGFQVDISYLNWDMIISEDEDYVKVGPGHYYFNMTWFNQNVEELIKENVIAPLY